MSPPYLSPVWLAEAAAAFASADLRELPTGEIIRFGYTITDAPPSCGSSGAVSYTITLDPSVPMAILEPSDGAGDVRFTMSYAVAKSVASGLQNGSKAFLNGEVQLGGDVALLISRAKELSVVDGLLPRSESTNSVPSADG